MNVSDCVVVECWYVFVFVVVGGVFLLLVIWGVFFFGCDVYGWMWVSGMLFEELMLWCWLWILVVLMVGVMLVVVGCII